MLDCTRITDEGLTTLLASYKEEKRWLEAHGRNTINVNGNIQAVRIEQERRHVNNSKRRIPVAEPFDTMQKEIQELEKRVSALEHPEYTIVEEVLTGKTLAGLVSRAAHLSRRIAETDDPAFIDHWNKKLTPIQTEIDRRAKEEGDRKLAQEVKDGTWMNHGSIYVKPLPRVASVPIDTGIDLSEEEEISKERLLAAARDLRLKLQKSIAEDKAKQEKTIVSLFRRWREKLSGAYVVDPNE